ncbi:MAG: ATP-binding protein [Acholeplasmataceae bacterium]
MSIKVYIGETNLYDKKEKLERNKVKSWLKSVSAFSNSNGGKIIFGITDDNKIIGLDDFKGDSEFISETIKTRIDPIPEFDMEIKEFVEGTIIILSIFQGRNTPYYFIESSSRTAYKRLGNQSVTATSVDLLNLTLKGQKQTYDSLLSDKHIDNVTFKELRIEYNNRSGSIFEIKDLNSFGLVSENGVLTITGALFADGHQVYQSRVFCTRWNGLTKTHGLMEALDDREYEGNLLYLLKVSLDFVKRNNRKMWKKGSLYRVEYPDYPERAVQEAIVNAIVHRDYTIIGSEVHIDIFDDRMEIVSPGGMYDGTFIQDRDIFNISSVRRNPVIADLFARMNLMERRGLGLKKIIEAYEFEKNYNESLVPEFRSTESAFFTVLKNLNYEVINVGQNVGESVGQNVGKYGTQSGTQTGTQSGTQKENIKIRRQKIISTLEKNPIITAQELADEINSSLRTTKRDLAKLIEDGCIKYEGSSKDGKWVVLK